MTHEQTLTDIREGVESYTQLATCVGEGEIPPIMAMMAMGQWMACLLHKLVEWEVLSEDEVKALVESLADSVADEMTSEPSQRELELVL